MDEYHPSVSEWDPLIFPYITQPIVCEDAENYCLIETDFSSAK